MEDRCLFLDPAGIREDERAALEKRQHRFVLQRPDLKKARAAVMHDLFDLRLDLRVEMNRPDDAHVLTPALELTNGCADVGQRRAEILAPV